MNPDSIQAAKTNLSRLLARAEAGEEIVLLRDETPVVRIAPLEPVVSRRQFGALRGKVSLAPGFFDPLPDSELGA